jgi:DNA-binding LacI/PurR family transcriptional regulator
MQQRSSWRLTKSQEAYSRLTELAHRLGPDSKLPTVLELCSTLGVSKATLDGALRELEDHNVVYRRHGVGIFVSPRVRRTIVVICPPDFALRPGIRDFWNLLVRRAQERAATKQELLSFHFSAPNESDAVSLHDGLMADVRSGKIHGILTMGLDRGATHWLMEQGVPLVAFAAYAPDSPCTVNFDGSDIVRMGAEALLARGCRHIELWKSLPSTHDWEEFDNGNKTDPDLAALPSVLKANRSKRASFVVSYGRPSADGSTAQVSETFQGIQLAQDVFGRRDVRPDGIVITNDLMAQGVLMTLPRHNITVNQDVVVATHSNRGSAVLHNYEEEVIRMEYDPAEIVQVLFDQLEMHMEGEFAAPREVLIRPQLRLPKLRQDVAIGAQERN